MISSRHRFYTDAMNKQGVDGLSCVTVQQRRYNKRFISYTFNSINVPKRKIQMKQHNKFHSLMLKHQYREFLSSFDHCDIKVPMVNHIKNQ